MKEVKEEYKELTEKVRKFIEEGTILDPDACKISYEDDKWLDIITPGNGVTYRFPKAIVR